MKNATMIAIVAAATFTLSGAAFAEQATTLAGGNNGGAGTHGAMTGTSGMKNTMPRSGGEMSGRSSTNGMATGTGESKGTATGGNPGGNATKN